MYETRYVRATSPQEAVSALQSSDDGKFLAGGMTLLPTMKQRLAAPDCVIDLSKCGLSGIECVAVPYSAKNTTAIGTSTAQRCAVSRGPAPARDGLDYVNLICRQSMLCGLNYT